MPERDPDTGIDSEEVQLVPAVQRKFENSKLTADYLDSKIQSEP